MAELKFETLNCQGTKYIVATPPTLHPTQGETITLKNDLNGSDAAVFQVFQLDDKGGTAISGFCDGQGDTVSIPGTGSSPSVDCKVAMSGPFEYTVASVGHETLDPVIIVEPQFMFSAPIIAAIGAIVAIGAGAVAYRAGLRAGARSRAA